MHCLYIGLHLRKEIIIEFHLQCTSVADALHHNVRPDNVRPEEESVSEVAGPSPLGDETGAPGHPQAAEGTEGECLGRNWNKAMNNRPYAYSYCIAEATFAQHNKQSLQRCSTPTSGKVPGSLEVDLDGTPQTLPPETDPADTSDEESESEDVYTDPLDTSYRPNDTINSDDEPDSLDASAWNDSVTSDDEGPDAYVLTVHSENHNFMLQVGYS